MSIFGDKELEKLTQNIKGFGKNSIEQFSNENWDTSLHVHFNNVKIFRQHILAPTYIMVLLDEEEVEGVPSTILWATCIILTWVLRKFPIFGKVGNRLFA